MDIDRYRDIKRSTNFKLYSFVSKGPKGELIKLVKFSEFSLVPDSYNLSLGTIRSDAVDFNETTDNYDRDQILATIFHIARTFSNAYPNQKIFIRGRNSATTRLYRGAINHEHTQLNREFFIYGGIYIPQENKYDFEAFVPDKRYDAFLFERR